MISESIDRLMKDGLLSMGFTEEEIPSIAETCLKILDNGESLPRGKAAILELVKQWRCIGYA